MKWQRSPPTKHTSCDRSSDEMETQNNKQWVCHSGLDHSGQLGPEDLSASGRTLSGVSGRSGVPDTDIKRIIPCAEQQVISEIQNNKNDLDPFFVQQVEEAICENSRQSIFHILDEVGRLTSIEKLLLYLKLPTDMNTISDPLRQPLNPLGSRTEISQTIMWIRTHLEEDPELSLPKQEVYNEYTVHCANNKMKPLSTADFGKVMKQVYPSVRPRRLGTRGNSRYCYAGLRKRFKLEVPELPALGDRPQATEMLATQNELTSAACTIICDWAESILGTRFQSVYVLASYLVRNAPQNVNINSAAASILANYAEGMHSKDSLSQELLPYSNHVNLKHKEAQLHLQRKLQQREFKRKLQLQSPKAEPKGKCKKSKMQGGTPTRTMSLDSMESESPKSQGYQLNPVCDKSTNECTVSTLPDFSSFHLKKSQEEALIAEKVVIKKDPEAKPSRSNSLEVENDVSSEENLSELKPNFAGKLPIPRLPNPKLKSVMQSPKSVILQAPKRFGPRNHLKYKVIQPKPAKNSEGNGESIDIQIAPDDSLKNADYLTRERLISVSQVDKDALDDYLHGGSNSQEQEEELMQYFKNNENASQSQSSQLSQSQTTEVDDLNSGSKSDKLSQLRLLLEQNLHNSNVMNAPDTPHPSNNKPLSILHKNNFASSHQNPVKRRVSFETSVALEDSVPPSPNTRRKNFSFTPISPGPHSPPGRQSKCNSTNASPFVSPRNTPVPRAKLPHQQVPPSFVAQSGVVSSSNRKYTKIKPVLEMSSESDRMFSEMLEEKHFVNPTDVIPKCNLNLPMSAPPSPMLPYKQKMNSNMLLKLLDSNNKVSYIPDYEKSLPTNQNNKEVSQLLSETSQTFNSVENYRSQSVPLHEMASFKTLMSPCLPNTQQGHFNFNFTSANNSVAPTPVPPEFTDFESFNEINSGLNNDNLNQILNILATNPANQMEGDSSAVVSSSAPVASESVFNFDPSATTAILNDNPMSVQKLNRSQSIDIHAELRGYKYIQQPSRSVPSTPVPFSKSKSLMDLNINNNQTGLQDSLNYNSDDFLLNGQPVKGKMHFPGQFTMNDNNKFRNEEGYSARRNLNPILEQQHFVDEEYTPVPRINSGTP